MSATARKQVCAAFPPSPLLTARPACPADAAETEVVRLEVRGGLVPAQGVEPVVEDVDVVEELRDRRVDVLVGGLGREVDREVEHAVGAALGPRQVGQVVGVQVRVGVDVVAEGLVLSVRDPARGGRGRAR